MKPLAVLFCCVVTAVLLLLVVRAGKIHPLPDAPVTETRLPTIDDSVARVNQWLREHWSREGITPAELADDLTVYRRLSLALHGTIPSLEEITAFQSDRSADRLDRWTQRLLEDRRFPDYFAARLARVLTGVDEGQFVIFRRDRLRAWLGDQLAADVPWNTMTESLMAADGLWTSEPESNFITAAFIEDEGIDENILAGRTVRAFLGQRIDCAQCHDHPFDTWTQKQFEGLAAWYGQARVIPGGVIDRPSIDGEPTVYRVMDPGSETGRIVEPTVPFHPEWVSDEGSRRRRLSSWVTHPENRRFERAIANRIWGLMFGRAWFDPVDDLPHPENASESRDLLDVLGKEFRRHDCRLQFLIRLIARSDAFRLQSEVPGVDDDTYSLMTEEWAAFPLVRLRPEQMIGAMFQAGRVRTADRQSNVFTRFFRFTTETDFLKEYGDAEDDELLQRTGTIPQALLRMNGRFTRELTETGIFSAAGQIMRFSGDDETLVRNCFLACLTRIPTHEEETWFVDLLKHGRLPEPTDDANDTSREESFSREQTVRDLYWILFNSPGFSWNR